MNLTKIAHSKITWYNCYSKLYLGISVWNPCSTGAPSNSTFVTLETLATL